MNEDILKKMFKGSSEEQVSIDDALRQLAFQGRMETIEIHKPVNILAPGDKKLSGRVIRAISLGFVDMDYDGVSIRFDILYDPFDRVFYCKEVLPARKLIYETIQPGTLLVFRFNNNGIPALFVVKDKNGQAIKIDEDLRTDLMSKFKEALIGIYVEAELAGEEDIDIWKRFISYFELEEDVKKTLEAMKKLRGS